MGVTMGRIDEVYRAQDSTHRAYLSKNDTHGPCVRDFGIHVV